MKYWLTTHWPPRSDGLVEELGVWLQEDHLHAADGMDVGDLVAIYEFKKGLATRVRYADQSEGVISRQRGRGGIVRIAEVSGRLMEREDWGVEHYTDGRTLSWKYFAGAKSINSTGFVDTQEVGIETGLSNFRHIGIEGSGLKELSQEQFRRLQQRFVSSTSEQDATTREAIASAPRFGPGGEGPEHLQLKLAIAADPAGVLMEPGLTLWKLEYLLPTADKIDVVLKDGFGRFVVVEVEVDCPEAEVVGPLQCMKYRAMVGYLHGRNVGEVRAILVAHGIHPVVRRRCKEHGIDCKLVDRIGTPTPALSVPLTTRP